MSVAAPESSRGPVSTAEVSKPGGVPISVRSDGPTAAVRLASGFAKLFTGGMLGKLVGVIREIALAASFGTGVGVGAFRAGQTATVVVTHTFTGDTLNAGFIPLCSRYARTDPRRAQSLFWTLTVLLSAIGVALSALLFLMSPFLARTLVPGFSPEAQALTALMIRAMAIGVPPYVLGALFSYMEMAHGRYLIASSRATIQNGGLLLGIGVAFWTSDPVFLAWGFTAYSILFAVFGLASLLRNGLVSRPGSWVWVEAGGVLREFAVVVRPLLLLPLVFHATSVVERIVASIISPDMVAALDYAKFFSESGLALLAVPLGLAGLSELGRMGPDEARRTLDRTVALLLIVLVPCSVFLSIHGTTLIRVVFGRGEFGETAVQATSLILIGLAVGFWAHVTGYVLLKTLSARERNREVLRITALASAAHIAVNLLFFRYLGALSLGLAIAAYGLVVFILTMRATKVSRVVTSSLLPLLAGSIVYVPLALAARGDGPMALASSAALALAFWMAFVWLVPRFRALLPDPAGLAGRGGAQ